MSALAFGINTDAPTNGGLANDWTRVVRPFDGLLLVRPPRWSSLPIPADRGAGN